MGGLALLLHDVPARSKRSFYVSVVCVAATVRVFVVITMSPRSRAAALSHQQLISQLLINKRPAAARQTLSLQPIFAVSGIACPSASHPRGGLASGHVTYTAARHAGGVCQRGSKRPGTLPRLRQRSG